MAPKRKAEGELVGDQGQQKKRSDAAGLAVKRKATVRKSLIVRFIDAGKLREEAEVETALSNTDQDRSWLEKLARHLACEPAFIDWMRNPGPMNNVNIRPSWLASVYLPGRYARYTGEDEEGFTEWTKAWFAKQNRRMDMLARAEELCRSVAPFSQTKLENFVLPFPDNSVQSQKLRQNLFQLQAARQRLSATIKYSTDVQHDLAGTIKESLAAESSENIDERLAAAVEELSLLERIKTGCREILVKSALNKVGVDVLDKLLMLVPEDEKTGVLYQIPATDASSITETTGAAASISDADIAQRIQAEQNFQIDYLDGRTLADGTDEVFYFRTANTLEFMGVRSNDEPKIQLAEVDRESIEVFDKESASASWLEEISQGFDHERFTVNYRILEGCYERPLVCETATYGDSAFWETAPYRAAVFKDNVVHVRRLVASLVDANLIVKDENEDAFGQLQIVLRRMIALLAVSFGCCSEPALLCTIMDCLLEGLANLIIGHKDPRLETLRMRRVSKMLSSMGQQEKEQLPSNSITSIERLERESKARKLFAEIARFYRGAVVISIAAVSPSKSNRTEYEMEVWFEALVQLPSKCGHRGCLDQLEVRKIEEAKKNKWGISVAVKDSRLGFPAERVAVSTNRSQAYPCLVNLIHFTRYHDALAVFFHYFTHLYHATCKAFRGKSALLDDITVMEMHEEQRGQA